jgi:hypothetical protein
MTSIPWVRDLFFGFEEKAKQYPDRFKSIPKDSDKMCVIVEPREHDFLSPVLHNFMYYLAPKGFGLMVFHGSKNKDFLQKIVKDWSYVHLVNMEVENLTIADYNRLLTSVDRFWDKIPAENVLIFQTDTFIRNDKIDPFLAYDYVGAPWHWHPMKRCGNGGLSFRKKSASIKVIKSCHYNGINEDVYFSYNMNVAPTEVGYDFSIETLYSPNPFGFHNAWGHIPVDKIRPIIENYSFP